MINTLKIYDALKETVEPAAAKKFAEIFGMIYEDLQNTVTKTEFNELKAVVKDLAEAQKRTEAKVERLASRVEELVEAQKRTEARVEELAEAQKRTEARVEELAEAQKRTEARVEELAEAQKRTEIKVEQLAEAQRKTETTLGRLIKDHRETRRQLGGLAIAFGYTLENAAFKALPELLKRDFGIVVKDRLKRQYVQDNKGQFIEINILGKASRNGDEITIVGESKSQLSRNGVDDFLRKKIRRLEGVYDNIFGILVTHMTTSVEVERYVRDKDITLYYSYDL